MSPLGLYTGRADGLPSARPSVARFNRPRSPMAQTAPSVASKAKADPFSVLVMDGNEEHQILSVAALTRMGAIVRTAASGQQALKLAISNPFDVFVIGSKLRDATGIEVLRLLTGRFPAVPKIFVVPPDGEEAAVRAMKSGATSYIVKTPRYTELLPAIVGEFVTEARNRRRLVETEQFQAQVLTERKTAEERLSQSETRLRMILHQVPVLVWSTDRDLFVTSAMGGGFRGLDTKHGGERGLSLFDYFNVGEEGIEPITSHRRALKGESVSTRIEWQGRIYEVRIEPLRSSEETVVGTMGVAFDVTERWKAERAVRESNEALLALVAASPSAIVTFDPEGNVTSWSPAAERIFGWRAADVIGGPMPAIPAGKAKDLQEVLQGKADRATFEGRWHRKDGTPLAVGVSAAALPDGQGKARGSIAVIEDLSTRRANEDRLTESKRLATVGQLAGFLAHELNTPLTSISLLAHAVSKRVTDPAALEKLEKIERQRRRASEIVRGLQNLSTDGQKRRIDTDLRSVVTSAVERVRRKPRKGVRVDIEIGASPVPAAVDPLQIQEVVANLVQNAIDATENGSIRVRVEDRPASRAIVVADTGSGMPPEVQARLFEPFFTTKPHGEGIGLGLLLSKRIVADHGGTIDVSSELGRGSTFTVHLPRKEGA